MFPRLACLLACLILFIDHSSAQSIPAGVNMVVPPGETPSTSQRNLATQIDRSYLDVARKSGGRVYVFDPKTFPKIAKMEEANSSKSRHLCKLANLRELKFGREGPGFFPMSKSNCPPQAYDQIVSSITTPQRCIQVKAHGPIISSLVVDRFKIRELELSLSNSSDEKTLPLKSRRISGDQIQSEEFDPPNNKFDILIRGITRDGNPFEETCPTSYLVKKSFLSKTGLPTLIAQTMDRSIDASRKALHEQLAFTEKIRIPEWNISNLKATPFRINHVAVGLHIDFDIETDTSDLVDLTPFTQLTIHSPSNAEKSIMFVNLHKRVVPQPLQQSRADTNKIPERFRPILINTYEKNVRYTISIDTTPEFLVFNADENKPCLDWQRLEGRITNIREAMANSSSATYYMNIFSLAITKEISAIPARELYESIMMLKLPTCQL